MNTMLASDLQRISSSRRPLQQFNPTLIVPRPRILTGNSGVFRAPMAGSGQHGGYSWDDFTSDVNKGVRYVDDGLRKTKIISRGLKASAPYAGAVLASNPYSAPFSAVGAPLLEGASQFASSLGYGRRKKRSGAKKGCGKKRGPKKH